MYGGAVMCLQYDARKFTNDIDAHLAPKDQFEQIILEIANERGLPIDWLNDSVVQFASEYEEVDLFLELSNLAIYTAAADYLLALKIQSFRIGISSDEDDIEFLISKLGITTITEVITIVNKYFPKGDINQHTQYAIQYLIEERNDN